jgi:peptidylprolyl isomerase
MLVFDIELLDIDPAPPLPPVPDDVSGPPEDAERSESGLAWRVLKKGRGADRPSLSSKVKIAYTVWDTDGKLFRSTILEGRPAEMEVGRVSSEGLKEGLQLMARGEKRRLWVPAELAYKGRFGGPEGMVVMDIELLRIIE